MILNLDRRDWWWILVRIVELVYFDLIDAPWRFWSWLAGWLRMDFYPFFVVEFGGA